ncbi:MAG: endonuclease III [Candidatus Levybacteria bacterium RIFCSPLOWO2_01_FULL_38_13]|nr:MAG: endonuclease III [Candidatus Levybacteria bacterium RIFCSPHIGHO2_01_FULL_41_15]OGH34793.1 MAG: endonuclease III [Candidatus Levybacteria bacterium RIFCSPLOWO2_01_FULL_38_13]
MKKSRRQKALKIVKELKKLFPTSKTALVYSTPFELLVAVILSARNTDKKVNEITKKLFEKYETVDDFKNANIRGLEKDLSQLGLFRQKAKFIKETAKIISENYSGEIPKRMDELIKLPGVGRKTANIILGNIYGIVEGIAVDTHVTRLSKLFGLTKNSDPNKIEKDLMEIIPKEEWFDFTNRMIAYGRLYCPAHCRHTQCPLKRYIGI